MYARVRARGLVVYVRGGYTLPMPVHAVNWLTVFCCDESVPSTTHTHYVQIPPLGTNPRSKRHVADGRQS